jgi:hypothetical protein
MEAAHSSSFSSFSSFSAAAALHFVFFSSFSAPTATAALEMSASTASAVNSKRSRSRSTTATGNRLSLSHTAEVSQASLSFSLSLSLSLSLCRSWNEERGARVNNSRHGADRVQQVLRSLCTGCVIRVNTSCYKCKINAVYSNYQMKDVYRSHKIDLFTKEQNVAPPAHLST